MRFGVVEIWGRQDLESLSLGVVEFQGHRDSGLLRFGVVKIQGLRDSGSSSFGGGREFRSSRFEVVEIRGC